MMAFDQPDNARYFAIVPAAGHSRRMGSSKLSLPWPVSDFDNGIAAPKVIDAVLHAWTTSRVAHVIVVIRSADHALIDACAKWPVQAVVPNVDPVDMKQSLQIGLRYIENNFSPISQDRCFIAPADLPALSYKVADALIDADKALRIDAEAATLPPIVVPRFGAAPGTDGADAKTGHPALIPWALTEDIFRLGENEGVDRIVKNHPRHNVDLPWTLAVTDINTPEEYKCLLASREPSQSPTDNADS